MGNTFMELPMGLLRGGQDMTRNFVGALTGSNWNPQSNPFADFMGNLFRQNPFGGFGGQGQGFPNNFQNMMGGGFPGNGQNGGGFPGNGQNFGQNFPGQQGNQGMNRPNNNNG